MIVVMGAFMMLLTWSEFERDREMAKRENRRRLARGQGF